jgi:hypothetical protein
MKADELVSLAEEAVECQNCDWVGHNHSLKPIKDISERVSPGEETPAGECPECRALAHFIEREEA